MQTTWQVLQSQPLANDIAIVARRHGKTAPAYIRTRMLEALINDIATEVVARYDLSSDKQIASAMRRLRALSDELIIAIADFKQDARCRRVVRELRQANSEGELSITQNSLLATIAGQEEDFAIAKSLARLEARRRGLKVAERSRPASRLS